jgi:hypothetical protein
MLPLDKHHTPQKGLSVITRDGAHLGTVRETSGSYFKVDAPMHRDYWLSDDLVKALDDGGVVLDVLKDDIGQYQRSEPGLEAGEDTFERIAGNAVLTAEELLEQRANMERELAEQSRDLPPHEPSVTQMRGPRAYERIPVDHTGFGDLAGGYVPNAPVQDAFMEREQLSHSHKRGRLAFPLLALGVLGVTGVIAFAIVRKRRHTHRERIRDHASAAAHLAADRARSAATDSAHEARRMLARRGASVAHRIEERLQHAA